MKFKIPSMQDSEVMLCIKKGAKGINREQYAPPLKLEA